MKYLYISVILALSLLPSCGSDDDKVELFRWEIGADLELLANGNVFTEISTELTNIVNTYPARLINSALTDDDVGQVEVLEATLLTLDGTRLNFISSIDLDVLDNDNVNNDLEIAFREPVEQSTGSQIQLFIGTANSTQTGINKVKELFGNELIGFRITYRVENSNPNIRARLQLTMRAVQ